MKRILTVFLCLGMVFSMTACLPQAETPVSESGYGLWFAVSGESHRSDYSAVVKESRQWEGEPTAEDLIEALLRGPESDGLYAPFPNGVRLQSVFINEETKSARVDLSEQYGGLVGFDLTLADYCIALTLCQLPNVEKVLVLVDGKTLPYRDRQEMQTGDVLLSGIAEEPDTFLAALYFPKRVGGTLSAEYRQVNRTGDSTPAEIAMIELLHGPVNEGDNRPLPMDTQIRSLTVSNGLCQIDLTEEFLLNAPQETEQAGLTVYAVVNTLCALAGVNQVYILVEGQVVENYGGISLATPLSANYDLAEK